MYCMYAMSYSLNIKTFICEYFRHSYTFCKCILYRINSQDSLLLQASTTIPCSKSYINTFFIGSLYLEWVSDKETQYTKIIVKTTQFCKQYFGFQKFWLNVLCGAGLQISVNEMRLELFFRTSLSFQNTHKILFVEFAVHKNILMMGTRSSGKSKGFKHILQYCGMSVALQDRNWTHLMLNVELALVYLCNLNF